MRWQVALICALLVGTQGWALYSEQAAEQTRNNSATRIEKLFMKAAADAKAFSIESAKWTATLTPEKGRATATASPTATATATPVIK